MKPIFKKVDSKSEEAFVARIDEFAQFYNKWHFHPELELTHIVKGRGTRFVGDNIEFFKDGDLILIGSNLPHVWKNQNKESELSVARVVQFLPNFMGDDILKLVEFKNIQKLLIKSSFGLKIEGEAKVLIICFLNKLFKTEDPLERIILIIKMLDCLGTSDDPVPISKSLFLVELDKQNKDRLNRVIDYTITNFASKIRLEDVASISNMSVSNFCKFFKVRVKKTYVQYLTEVRIGMSCKMLIENQLSINRIAYDSGFVNISNFNRAFKLNKNMTPFSYRKLYHLG
ncbi:MAG: AraC family transcriptional regulator [Cytophagales bacterium]|nr:AraC family transcriptional regulator [Cytophagales bacterium]